MGVKCSTSPGAILACTWKLEPTMAGETITPTMSRTTSFSRLWSPTRELPPPATTVEMEMAGSCSMVSNHGWGSSRVGFPRNICTNEMRGLYALQQFAGSPVAVTDPSAVSIAQIHVGGVGEGLLEWSSRSPSSRGLYLYAVYYLHLFVGGADLPNTSALTDAMRSRGLAACTTGYWIMTPTGGGYPFFAVSFYAPWCRSLVPYSKFIFRSV